jgi:hypothetical protein
MQIQRFARNARAAARRGSVIVLSLVVLTALLMMGAALYRIASAADNEVRGREDDQHAFYLAEAGLAEAMVSLRAGSSGAIASEDQPAYLSGGVLWVTADDLGGKRTRLVANGMAGAGRAALEVVVEDQSQAPLFRAVLNSDDVMTLASSVQIDSFDSELGTYAAQATNNYNGMTYAKDNGDVLSNKDVILNSSATVFGDAKPGPGHTVSLANGAYVSGSTAPSPEPFLFTPIPVPPVAGASAYNLPASASATIPPGTWGYGDFTLNKASKLTITGPATLVVNNFSGGKDARLTIDASGGPVTIFVQGSYTHLANFEAQPKVGSPMALAFMVQGNSDVVFPNLTKVRGAYYVPNANVVFSNDNEAWGSFAARKISMSNTMKFHYDESLAKHWETNGQGKTDPLQMLSWSQTSPPAEVLGDRRDPYQVLDVVKKDLPTPTEAWVPAAP